MQTSEISAADDVCIGALHAHLNSFVSSKTKEVGRNHIEHRFAIGYNVGGRWTASAEERQVPQSLNQPKVNHTDCLIAYASKKTLP